MITSLEPLASTPGGIPRRRFWLDHRSRQQEAGAPREVRTRIAVILTGEPARMSGLAEGRRVRVGGFLARAGYHGEARERLQLHAETVQYPENE